MTNPNKETTKQGGFWQKIVEIPQNVVRYIYAGFARIFGPRDDNYPETGVQPFEGDPPKNRHQ
ncbi:hypothetical protein [Fischerella sp. PCC 9605]|uniref:hypothetical protein n=1 Tax=Fischerella sp. PCC 9605 TaxID=1173024 RepID=UPI00047A6EC5|nr:hypothetical protein [Fischerella sp. PCC 9605]